MNELSVLFDCLRAAVRVLAAMADLAGGLVAMGEVMRQILVLLVGYTVTLLLSGLLVRRFTTPPDDVSRTPEEGKDETEKQTGPKSAPRVDPGAVIGKCENILALTFVLGGEVAGLAIIFAAKSLVRRDRIHEYPSYYLGGTLVNFTWSVVMGFILRYVLGAI